MYERSVNLEYVGFLPRVGATIIDTILLLLITSPLLVWVYGWAYYLDPNMGLIAGPADLLLSWVFPAVAVIAFWLYLQATPGKMAISARVVDAETGNTLSPGQAVLRYVGYFVAILPLFLGVIWVAFDPQRQGWHDKIAGSVVVRPKNRDPEPVTFAGA